MSSTQCHSFQDIHLRWGGGMLWRSIASDGTTKHKHFSVATQPITFKLMMFVIRLIGTSSIGFVRLSIRPWSKTKDDEHHTLFSGIWFHATAKSKHSFVSYEMDFISSALMSWTTRFCTTLLQHLTPDWYLQSINQSEKNKPILDTWVELFEHGDSQKRCGTASVHKHKMVHQHKIPTTCKNDLQSV